MRSARITAPAVLLALGVLGLGCDVAFGGYESYALPPPLVEAGPAGHALALVGFRHGLGSSFAEPGASFATPVSRMPLRLSSVTSLGVDGAGAGTLLSDGYHGEVTARTSPPGRGFWHPTRLGAGNSEGARLAVAANGAAVAVWKRDERLEVAIRPAGGSFGPARDAGPVDDIGGLCVDGAGGAHVLVTNSSGPAVSLVSLAPDGPSRTQALPTGPDAGSLAQDSTGRLLAVTLGTDRRLHTVLIEADGRLGPVHAISSPPVVLSYTKVLGAVLEPSGRAAVAWSDLAWFSPYDIRVAEGDAIAGFAPSRRLDRRGEVDAAGFAANARGDAVVTWSSFGYRPRASLRPAGGRFAAPMVVSPYAGDTGEALEDTDLGDGQAPTAAVLPDGDALIGWTERRAHRYVPIVRRVGPGGADGAQPLAVRPITPVLRRPRARCRSARKEALAHNRYAVYRRVPRSREREVCSLSTGWSARFADVELGDFLHTVRLAGPFAAWATVYGSTEGPSPYAYVKVFVRDARTGIGPGPIGIVLDQHVAVGDLVLAPDGAVAAITCRAVPDILYVKHPTRLARQRCSRPGRPTEVVVGDALGRTGRVVDRGRSIDPRSLALNGRRLFWRNGGHLRSALLRRIRLPG